MEELKEEETLSSRKGAGQMREGGGNRKGRGRRRKVGGKWEGRRNVGGMWRM